MVAEEVSEDGCDGCNRYSAVCAVVASWLRVEIGNAPADAIHLRGTLTSAIEALGPGNPKLHHNGHADPGETLDEQATILAAGCPAGYEEAEAVVLRRAAELLLARAHGKAGAYRGASKGAYRIPLRLIDPEDLKIP